MSDTLSRTLFSDTIPPRAESLTPSTHEQIIDVLCTSAGDWQCCTGRKFKVRSLKTQG